MHTLLIGQKHSHVFIISSLLTRMAKYWSLTSTLRFFECCLVISTLPSLLMSKTRWKWWRLEIPNVVNGWRLEKANVLLRKYQSFMWPNNWRDSKLDLSHKISARVLRKVYTRFMSEWAYMPLYTNHWRWR